MFGAAVVALWLAVPAMTAADRHTFVSWFRFLAEWQAFRPPPERPAEINDCAALLRYAYREALRRHDAAWIRAQRLPVRPPFGELSRGYDPLFSTGAQTRAHFADAEHLMRWNTRFLSRDVRLARPGDLLFFRQGNEKMPFHSMVFLGPSTIDPAPGPFVVYHTGEDNDIRRPALSELLRHPEPRWRPVEGNPNFLGVYRWNILSREED